ncbi:MAG: TonB-dependent receptor, partial [bacterium]|nr:TonB-dependent receptor [bacterium]
VSKLTEQDIEWNAVQSVPDLLDRALGVSINSRGIPGVQADISLRGAGFEQVLILLNGMRINDPQTGHHNMNLPVSLADVKNIEVLRGQSSALYGPDAFGGVVNIITKNSPKKQFDLRLKAGSFGTVSSSASAFLPGSKFRNRITLENSRSDGFRKDTEFLQNTVNFQSDYSDHNRNFSFFTGYIQKDFGANEYYGKNWDSYEEIDSYIAQIRGDYTFDSGFKLSANTYFKQHEDFFQLSVENPDIYQVDHKTRRAATEITGKYSTEDKGTISFGTDLVFEDINSSSLGEHDVNRISFFSEYGYDFNSLFFVDLGIRYDRHSLWQDQFNPSLSAGYILSSSLVIRASAGRSFRAPTFLELYYDSPANKGNPDLKPEKALAFDIGAEYSIGQHINGESTVYFRDQDETIDWIKSDPADPWQVENIFEIRSKGLEQSLEIDFSDRFSFRMNYTYLDQDREQTDFISKYVFIHPRHQLMIDPGLKITENIDFYPSALYKDRSELNKYWIFNTKLSIKFKNSYLTLEGLNLTDESYQEIRDVPMPGRSFFAGLKLSF